jgi:hypothetical protein
MDAFEAQSHAMTSLPTETDSFAGRYLGSCSDFVTKCPIARPDMSAKCASALVCNKDFPVFVKERAFEPCRIATGI